MVSVPDKAKVLLTVKVLGVVPPAIVNPVAAAVKVKPFTVLGVIAPKVKAKAPAVFVAETPLPVVTELTKVPEVGRVTEVVPVVNKDKALVAENVITSPPAKVMALVLSVVESETVKVFVLEIVRVADAAGAVKVTLLIVVAVASPNAGVTRVGEVSKTIFWLVVPVVPVAAFK